MVMFRHFKLNLACRKLTMWQECELQNLNSYDTLNTRGKAGLGWIWMEPCQKVIPQHVRGGIGPPVALMLNRVLHWISSGRTVKIFTARAGDNIEEERIHQWCLLHGLPKLEITNRKDYRMIALWDDRAVGVVTNLGIPILPASMTLWLRFRLGLSILFGCKPTMKVNELYLSGLSDDAMSSRHP